MKKIVIKISEILILFSLCQCQYKMHIMVHKLNFYTSHHQFYITDKDSNDTSGNFWSNENYDNRLGVGRGVLGIGTESYGPIKGELDVLVKAKDTIDYSSYDHIVEGDLEIVSGVLQVQDCPSSHVQLEIKIKPGNYRVRVYSSHLSSVIDEDKGGDDYYKVEIWPATNMELKVLKKYIRH